MSLLGLFWAPPKLLLSQQAVQLGSCEKLCSGKGQVLQVQSGLAMLGVWNEQTM